MHALILSALVWAAAAAAPPPAGEIAREASAAAWRQVATERGGEAMYLAERAAKFFWPTLDPTRLALLIYLPDGGAVLLNHPSPPAGFLRAEPLPRFRTPDELQTGDLDPNAPGWSVSAARSGALERMDWLEPGATAIGAVPTAVVGWDEVSGPPPGHRGLPPSEAAACRMLGRLWLAHLDALEGEQRLDPAPWSYRADESDLALIAVEHRLLARMMRINVSEKTMDRYKRLFSMWLAARRARLAARPDEVALEEAIERRDGLASFTETVPFRVLLDPGNETRTSLERQDPFYDRYRSYLLLRVGIINQPILWHPATPVEALAGARSRGAALAYAVWFLAPRWNTEFLTGPRRTLREIASQALQMDPGAEADFLKEAKEAEGYEGLRETLRRVLADRAGAGAPDPAAAAGLPLVSLQLPGLTSYRGAPEQFVWLGPGRVEATGRLRMAFPGGSLKAEGPGIYLESGTPRLTGGDPPLTLTWAVARQWQLSVGGKRVDLPGKGRRTRALEGSVQLESGEVALRAGSARITSAPGMVDIDLRPARPGVAASSTR